jgi:hypothetical protein
VKFNFKLKIVATSGGLALSAWSALIDMQVCRIVEDPMARDDLDLVKDY